MAQRQFLRSGPKINLADRRAWGLLCAALAFSCSETSAPPDVGAGLTVQQLSSALQLPERVPGPVLARVESRQHRRDLVTEQLTLTVGDASIPAIACYSQLGASQKLPAVLWMPGSPNIKEDLISPVDLLLTWADRGFFVLSIDRPFHGERPGDREEQLRQRGIPAVYGDYVVDLIHAIDYMSQRPEVDPVRMGMVGLSTGGLEALIVGALDRRLNVVVSVSGQLAWPEVFATDAWKRIFAGLPLADSLITKQVPGDRALAVMSAHMPGLAAIDAARIAPLLAPRPMLLLSGAIDPLIPAASAMATATAAQAAYDAAGASQQLSFFIEPERGHAFSRQMQTLALSWCERWL